MARLARLFTSALLAFAASTGTGRAQTPRTVVRPTLRIVVIEGEDAVNVIQQGTAVAPVVEVRDQNNQPISGALVRFAIRSGRGSFNGARTLSVTTNASGRAVASGFTPSGTGGLQIGATATFEGHTANVTIAQTSVLTAAQAASVGVASVSSGVSATTVGVIGGAVAGGTVVATKALSSGSASDAEGTTTYTGTFSGSLTLTFGPCSRTEQDTGTLSLALNIAADGSARGTASVEGSSRVIAVTCPAGPQLNAMNNISAGPMAIAGAGAALTADYQRSNSFQDTPTSPVGVHTIVYSFSGALSGGVISGALTHTEHIDATVGSVTHAVTLR